MKKLVQHSDKFGQVVATEPDAVVAKPTPVAVPAVEEVPVVEVLPAEEAPVAEAMVETEEFIAPEAETPEAVADLFAPETE